MHPSDAGRRAHDRPPTTGAVPHTGASSSECCEPIALLGCGAGGERIWLGRSPRDGELLAVVGDGPGCALMPAMDIHGPPGATGCRYCGATETRLRRRCPRCGSDLSGIALESGPDTTREALRQRAAEAATGCYQLLGDIPRAEGGGLLFIGRALDGSGLVALRLERRLQGVNGREYHALVPVQPLASMGPGRGFSPGAPRGAVRAGAAAAGADFARPRATVPRHAPLLPVLLPVADAAERGIAASGARRTTAPEVGRESQMPARDRLPLAAYAGVLGVALLGAMAVGAGPSRSAAEGGEVAAMRARPAARPAAGAAAAPATAPAAQGAAQRAVSAAVARPVSAGAVSASRGTVSRPVYGGGQSRLAPLAVRGADDPAPRERTVGLAAARSAARDEGGSAPDAEATGPARERTRAPAARAAVERRGTRGATRGAARVTRAATGDPRQAVEPAAAPGAAWRGKPVGVVRRAALLGDGSAQVALGLAYERGEGVRRDEREALAWFRKAADHGDAWARNHLGWLLANGRGTAVNGAEAVRLFRLAAMQGNSEAEFNLGFMYASGRGVARSEQEAVSWYRRAARHGLAAARAELQRLGAAP